MAASFDVFICHNHADKESSQQLAERLMEEGGITSWLDRWSIPGGDDWERAIQRALESCSSCAVVIGRHGWGDYQLREAHTAVKRSLTQRDFRVIPVLFQGARTEDLAGLGEYWTRAQWVDLSKGLDDEEGFRTLVAAIRKAAPGPPQVSAYLVRSAAARWENSGRRDASLLYHGANLRKAQNLRRENPDQFNESALVFLDACERRQRRTARIRAGTIAVAFLVVVIASLIAWWQFRVAGLEMKIATSNGADAEQQRLIATGRTLAAQSVSLRSEHGSNLAASVLLAVESLRRAFTIEGYQALQSGLVLLPRFVFGKPIGSGRKASFSPDGKYIAAVVDDPSLPFLNSSNRAFRVWNTATGSEVALVRLSVVAKTLSFTDQSNYLAVVDEGGNAILYDTRDWRQSSHAACGGLEFTLSGNGRYCGVISAEDIRILNLVDGRGVADIKTKDLTNTQIAMSFDGAHIAVYNLSGEIHVWDVHAPRESIQVTAGRLGSALALNPNGSLLAFAGNDNAVRMWDLKSRQELPSIRMENVVDGLSFSRDGVYLATGCRDHTASVWEARTGQEVFLAPRDGSVSEVEFSPDGVVLAALASFRDLSIWDITGGNNMIRGNDPYVRTTALRRDGRSLAILAGGTVKVLNAVSPLPAAQFPVDPTVNTMALSSDGKYLAITDLKGSISVRSLPSGSEISHIAFRSPTDFLTLSVSGRYLVSAVRFPYHPEDGQVCIWETQTGKQVGCTHHPGNMTSVAIRDDERFLLISGDKFARLWNIQTGTDAWSTPVSDQTRSVSFDEKGESVAVLSSLGEFVILDEATGHESRRGKLPIDVQIVFRANGEYLAAGTFGQVIRVFNLNGQELARVGQPQKIESVAFSSDGMVMATTSYNGLPIVQMWQANDLIETACRNLDRNLTQEEWRKYFAGESYRKTCPNR